MEPPTGTLYGELGVPRDASQAEIKRAYRTLRTSAHPDKGGDAERFNRLVTAFNVLSDPDKRAHYDATGEVHKSAGEAFVEAFAGGSFADRGRRVTAAAASLATSVADQIAIRQSETQTQSHTAGFEAWLRSRGSAGTAVFTADTMADTFGVVKASYEAVPLAARSVLAAVCKGPGRPQEQVQLETKALPPELEWGEVLVEIRLAPVTPADIYSMRLGGVYDDLHREPPFTAGHDCVGVVTKVGPGVKGRLREGDVVLPATPLLGTFTQAGVYSAKSLVQVGHVSNSTDGDNGRPGPSGPDAATLADDLPLPLEYLAIFREMATAYTLLEAHGALKPGDCVIMNASNSMVGRTLLQLCKLLKLRCVAVLRAPGGLASAAPAPDAPAGGQAAAVSRGEAKFQAVAEQLKELGASLVLRDEGSIKAQLAELRWFAKPKLALDAVGGDSAARLSEALEQGGKLIVYGCLGGKAPAWPWQAWVFRGLQVSGFNLRASLAADTPGGARRLLASLGKLVRAGLLVHSFTEYDFAEEFAEAVEHAMEAPGGSRVLLRMAAAP